MKNIFYILLFTTTFLYSQCTEGEVELWNVCYNIEETTVLELYNTGLTGQIPSEIGELTNLTQLNLGGNELTGEIPPDIANLTNLIFMQLQVNELEGGIPSWIGSLTNLTYLNLAGNQLTGEIVPEIGNLINLTNLNLVENQLIGEIPPEIENLTNLTHLFLSDNQFTGEIPPWIGNLTNLIFLLLETNQFTGEIPSEIGNLINLLEVRLDDCELTGFIPEEICNIPDQTIQLQNNQLCPPYPSCISQPEIYLANQDTSNCCEDIDVDAVCDVDEIIGCQDPDACNYDVTATDPSGDCDYVDFECETCENGLVLANDDDIDVICNDVDTCFGFNPSGDVDGDGICDNIDPCYGPTTLISWENTNGNGWADAEEAVFDYVDTDGDMLCDSVDPYPECDGVPDCAGECNGGSYIDNCGQCMCGPNSDPDTYECDDDDECEQGCDGQWYADLDAMPIDGCDGVCDSGATTDQCGICDANSDNDDINCTGCTESTACNYDIGAIISCEDCCLYPTGACQICQDGAVVDNDTDNDFACDDVDNCPDDSNEDQSDVDGDLFGDVCDICPLDSENDADGDGICESNEINGCTDNSACNYSDLVTEEDGTCTYVDGVCDSCENCFVSYSTGFYHTLGLKSDGTVEAWGGTNNSGPHNLNFGETEVPDGLTNVIAIEGGYGHSLALKSDGTVVGWGLNDAGQVNIPEDLNNVIAIQAGRNHSLALKSDGTVVGWGLNDRGQIDIPLDLDDVISISTGWHSSLALKSDGTVVGWGDDSWGLTTPPDNLSNVIEVSIASYSSNALLQDGTVVSWGAETFGGVTPDNLSNVVAIETGAFNVVALKDDGTVVVWGSSTNDINEVPSDLMNINSISFSYHHVIAQSATEVYTWGDNWQGQLNIPICGVIVDNDSDDDTVCDDVDICNGSDDYLDYDNDGLCDGVDPCIGIDTLDEECIFYGDINQDGNIDESDAIFLIGYLMGGSSELLGMDYNQDGTVDLLDCASLVYEIYDIDISSESLQNDSSDLGLALYYDSVNLITNNYVAGILLTLTTCDGCDFDFNLPSELVSTAVFTDTTAKILIMHDPRDQDSLEELLLDVVEGSYGIDVSQTQIIDVDSHLDFSLLYHMGDVNMDVIINILDVIHLIDIILSVTLDDDMNPYADINQDGVVNVMDVVLLVYFIFDMS